MHGPQYLMEGYVQLLGKQDDDVALTAARDVVLQSLPNSSIITLLSLPLIHDHAESLPLPPGKILLQFSTVLDVEDVDVGGSLF
jgi:hypothetical protein